MIGLLRFLTLAALLAFVVGLADPVAVTFVEADADHRSVELVDGGDVAGAVERATTAILAAAGRAGPRAAELTLRAARPVAELPRGPLGAELVTETAPLSFEPGAVRVVLPRPPAVGRPVELEVRLPREVRSARDGGAPIAGNYPVTLTVLDAVGRVLEETAVLRADRPAKASFVPTRAGRHRVTLAVQVADRQLTFTGAFDARPAPRVLVLEPSGNAAAALAAQGVAVDVPAAGRAIGTAELEGFAAVVVGAELPAPVQRVIADAMTDGLGVFVLAPGFGAPGAPLFDALPLLPEPRGAAGARVEGGGNAGAGGGATAPSSTPDSLPQPDPTQPDPTTDPAPADPTSPQPTPADRPPPTGEIEDPTPVSEDPIEVDKRSIAMVLVVDRSGSMGNVVGPERRSKMSYAKTSALQSARALTAGDQVGIVTFGNKNAARVELPLTDAEDGAAIRAGVARLAHGLENTFLLAGLQRAGELLAPAQVAVKHVVVVTDGEFRTDETFALRALAHRLFRGEGISCSILSIVDETTNTEFAKDAASITNDGGGQFFAIPAADQVPVFVSAEVARSLDRAGRSGGGGPGEGDGEGDGEPAPDSMTEPPDDPVADPPADPEPKEAEKPEPEPPQRVPVRAVARSPLLLPRPAAGTTWPTLGAAVPTTAPLDAAVLLVAGDDGWPLLCFGNRGLGRIGAFAADLFGGAGAEMRGESAFPARLTLWVQHVMRAERDAEPTTVALSWELDEPAPLPAGIAAFERLGGDRVTAAATAPAPALVRRTTSRLPDWALGALALVLLLAVVERVAVLRGRVA